MILALAAILTATPQSDVISTSSRGGNIVADARAWWSNPTGHSDEFRTQTSGCLGLLDQAEQHRLTAMRYYDQARAKGPMSGQERTRLQRLGNDEYAIVTRLVRQFYECARMPPDQINSQTRVPSDAFNTGGRAQPTPQPRSDRFNTGSVDPGLPPLAGGEKLCDMQQLALLVEERYSRPGRPIAAYRVLNAGNLPGRRGRETYVVVAQGITKEEFWRYWLGQVARAYGPTVTAPTVRALGELSESLVGNSYAKAIVAAVSDLPPGANLILVGHSLGGIELQRLVTLLKKRDNFVSYVATFGSPIVSMPDPGTRYRFVKADGDPVALVDRVVTGNASLVRIPAGSNINPFDETTGSHHIYGRSPALENVDALGNRRTLSDPCLEIDIQTRREYGAPGLSAATNAERPVNVHVDCPNCFWASLAQDFRWATGGQPFTAPKVSVGVPSEDVAPILKTIYGSEPVPTDLDPQRAAAFRAGQPVESSARQIEDELRNAGPGHRGLVFSEIPVRVRVSGPGEPERFEWREDRHVINVRAIPDPRAPNGTRVIYHDAQILDPSRRIPSSNTPLRDRYLGPRNRVFFYRTY